MEGTKRVIDTLMGYAKAFEPGTPQFNAYMGAIRTLNGVYKGAPAEEPKTPLPVPPTAPGGGLGGIGTPPPAVTGGGGPGAGPGAGPPDLEM